MGIVLKDENGRLLTTMFQWDTGRVITFDGADPDAVTEVHYDNDYGYKSQVIIPDVVDGVVKASVPNEILQQDRNFRVYIYQELPFGGKTTSRFTINVFPKLRPENYASNADYKHVLDLIGNLETLDTEAKDNLVNAINEAFNHSEIDPEAIAEAVEEYMAEHPFVEEDPNVPEWAKEPEKPAYTPQEVGADPAGTAAGAVSNHNESASAHASLFAQKASTEEAQGYANAALSAAKGYTDDAVSPITAKIPTAASSTNQLADKAFVNSTVGTNTAIFRGTFNSVAELEAYSGDKTNNDYAFVVTTDTAGNIVYNRYKFNGNTWVYEFALNNSSFTATQWAAIQSGITAEDVALIATALQPSDLSAYRTASAQDVIDAQLQTKSIADAGGYYTTDTVEGALAEVGAQLDGLESALDGINDVLEGAL